MKSIEMFFFFKYSRLDAICYYLFHLIQESRIFVNCKNQFISQSFEIEKYFDTRKSNLRKCNLREVYKVETHDGQILKNFLSELNF